MCNMMYFNIFGWKGEKVYDQIYTYIYYKTNFMHSS